MFLLSSSQLKGVLLKSMGATMLRSSVGVFQVEVAYVFGHWTMQGQC